MNKIKLIGDSTLDLTKDLYKEMDIDIVPLNVSFGSENFLDGETITLDDVYKKVAECGELPSTASFAPSVFEEHIKKYIDLGYDIIYVGIGSTLSSALQNARIAAGDYLDNRVFLIDSKNLSSASGLLAMKVAKYIKEGKLSAKEIVELVQPLADKTVGQFTVETLDYLKKGGRCSSIAAFIGNLLHIHPYLRVVDGKLIVYKKVRGPIRIALNEQLNDLKEALPNIDLDNVFVTHSGYDDGTEVALFNEVEQLVGKGVAKLTKAGCVIGSHCGPRTIGILYIKK